MRARESPGLIGDVASVAANGLRAVRTRLELVSIEREPKPVEPGGKTGVGATRVA